MSKDTSSKKVFVNSIIYSCSGLLIKCVNFFLLPIYTHHLSTDEYGINSLATSFISMASFVVSFSLFSAVMRFYVDLKDNKDQLKRFYGTVSLFVFISGIVFATVLTFARDIVSVYIFSGVDYYPIILVTLITLVFSCQHTIFDNILRSQQKALKSSIAGIVYFLVMVIFNIVFVVGFQMGAVGTLLATLIACVLYSLYFVLDMALSKSITFCIDVQLLKDALKYSVPIMPHNLSTHISTFISKLLISDVGSLSGVGVYSVALQFGNIADTVQGYVNQAYSPWLYECLKDAKQDNKKIISQSVKLLISVIGLFLLGIALFAQDYILLFVDSNYAEAWLYVPCITSVFAIKTIYYFYVGIMFYYKEASKKLFWATLTSSFLNVLLSIVFVPLWDVYGSIIADAISMVVRVMIVLLLCRQYGDVGLKVKDFVINFIAIETFTVIGLLPSVINHSSSFSLSNFVFKICVIFMYAIIALLLNRKALAPVIRKFKTKLYRR